MGQDGGEEVVVSDAEVFEVGRLLDAPYQDGELTLEHVGHEILLQVVHHERHVVPQLTNEVVIAETEHDKTCKRYNTCAD